MITEPTPDRTIIPDCSLSVFSLAALSDPVMVNPWSTKISAMPLMPFQNKPAAVFSASRGPVGGARVQYDLRRILSGLGVQWLARPEVFIGMAPTKFGHDGKLTDETTRKFLTDQMVAFEDWIKRMKRAFE